MYASLGWTDLVDVDEVKSVLEKSKQYEDSVDYYFKKDSVLRIGIINRKTPDVVYRYIAYIKATQFEKTEKKELENIMDTLVFYFDKDIKLVPAK